jgi:hypothetical protein
MRHWRSLSRLLFALLHFAQDLVKAKLRRFAISPSEAAYARPHLKTTRHTEDQ